MQLTHDSFLRVLKGAPLSVVLSLWVFGSMDMPMLIVRTGYKRDAVADALVFLESLVMVERVHYRKWQLSTGFQQLPFPSLQLAEDRKNRLSANVKIGKTDLEDRKNRSSPSSSYNKEKEEGEKIGKELQEAFRLAGIGRNMWKRLAACEWVTADLVAAHAAVGKGAGYVVNRLLGNEAVELKTAVSERCAVCGNTVSRIWGVCLHCEGVIQS